MNPYYDDPATSGLTQIAEVDWNGYAPYEFDITVLWKRESDGAILIASDSGCSCPTPFDDVTPEPVRNLADLLAKIPSSDTATRSHLVRMYQQHR